MIIIICQKVNGMPNPVFPPCEELRVLYQVWNMWRGRTGSWVNIMYKGSPNVIVKLRKQRIRNLQRNMKIILQVVAFSKLFLR